MNANGEVTGRHVLVRLYRFTGGGKETRITLINNGLKVPCRLYRLVIGEYGAGVDRMDQQVELL